MENKKPVDFILNARWVLPIAPKNVVLENHSVAIIGDRIAGIASSEQAKTLWQARQEIDLPNHVIMPGLVNAHAHTPLNLFKGLADDLLLMDWLKNHIWPAELAIMQPESVHDGMSLAFLEMLRSGTTCFCDHFFFHDTAAEAVKKAGIRANIGLWVGNVQTVWGQNEPEYFSKVAATLSRAEQHPLVTWSLAPHSPYMVTEAGFKQIKQLSEQYDLPIHLHLHESSAEIEDAQSRLGQRPIKWLDGLGLLTPKLIAVHMVQMIDEDIKTIAKRGVSIVHCPESNLKLASGLAPIGKFLQAGINVAIGTDSAASNNDLDMFGELRTAALLAKGVSLNTTTLPAS
ncbi:MAG: amidohydrolase family protein, partial [Proteobacteria bacterium]|nr:amidohydrolase family protein [Pseudomonadota bacterium]